MLRIEPTGTKNGANVGFSLPQASVAGALSFVILNGQLIEQVASAPGTTQCVLIGSALTMGLAPLASDDLFVLIQTTLGNGLVPVAITGIQNSVNTTFIIATPPPAGSSLLFFFNGAFLNQVVSAPNASQMVVSGTTVTMGLAPKAADVLTAYIENTFSYVFLHELPMLGAGSQWTTPLNAITGFSPLLMVFVNGQFQQEVMTVPIGTQFRQSATNTTLTILLGLNLSTGDSLEVYIVGLAISTVVVVEVPSLPTFLDMQNELLVLMNERIDAREAKMCLNRRWQKILNAWSWSFVKTDGVLTTQAPKTTGTLSVTEGGFFVVGTDTSFVAADVGATVITGGQSYEVLEVSILAPTQQLLRIDPPYVGVSAPTASYQLCHRTYALSADVVEILSMTGRDRAYEEITQEDLDVRDSKRTYSGQPYAYVRRDMVNGIYHIELWPVPDAQYVLRYTGLMRTVLTQRGQFIPDIAEVLLMAAEEMACGIVSSKCAGNGDYNGAQFWASKGLARHANYLESLAELKNKDRRRFGKPGGDATIRYHDRGYGWGGRETL